MEGVVRVSPREAYEKVKAGQALLVCAYESDARFEKYHLAEAISFNNFKNRFPSLPVEQEAIFYCN
ncbi:MAG: ArsR family transcriptional regulator [Desulfobulbaceae bacterium]|nr:ArsR family transcriptional regulator [Desulfobulbaceae bacterium]